MNLAEQVSNPVELMRRKVLIVDDHSINREILSGILDNDYDIMCAEDGKKALDVIEMYKDSLSAVLLDLTMPVMDGYETAAAIRSLKRQDVKTIPIIAMTANAFSEAFSPITEVGMNAHITKPIEPKVLWNTLKSFIS